MDRRAAGVVTLLSLLATLLVGAGPASAATGNIPDADRDGETTSLDFQRVQVSNNERAVVVTAYFDRVARGLMGVYLQADSGETVLVGADYRPGRERVLFYSAPRRTCRGLSVRWDVHASTARVRVPARCVAGGDYDAVRARLITEQGGDTDLVPDQTRAGTWPWSRWFDRA